MSNFAQLKKRKERKMYWKLLFTILCLVVSASSRPTSDSGEVQVQGRGLVKGITDNLDGMPMVGSMVSDIGDNVDSMVPV